MKTNSRVQKRRKSFLYSLFLCGYICLASSCSALSGNSPTTSNTASKHRSDAVVVKIATQAVATPDPVRTKAQAILDKMSLDDKIAQMLLVEYIGTDYDVSGLHQMVAQHVGGVLYQPGGDSNFDPPVNTIASVSAYSAQIIADEKIAPLIAVDEEGGEVDKITGPSLFPQSPSPESLVQLGDAKETYSQAAKDALELKQLGINVDLAPVVDVGPDTNLMISRMFSSDPTAVASYAGAFVKGLQDNGIPGTLKHFPGLGSVPNLHEDDPHYGLYTVAKSLDDLKSTDIAPYQKIIQEDNPAMIMTTDVLTQALNPATPADVSPEIVNYLRHTLNFNGVIITDGIYMGGLYDGGIQPLPNDPRIIQRTVQAIEAGHDIVEGLSTSTEITDTIAAVKSEIAKGTLSESQIDQSVLRILMMKVKYKIIV